MGWGANVKKRLAEQQLNVNNKIIDRVIVIGGLLVANSPTKPDAQFAKGLFKNSWYVSINEFDPTVGSAADMSGSGSLARIAALRGATSFVSKDGYISFTNNLPYAYRVEKLGWPQGEGANGWVWSGRVGPYAPVSNTITQYKAMVKA